MIFIDGERKTDFSNEREILKSIFPNSFDTDKPAPIIIQRKRGTYEMATLYKPAVTDIPMGQRMVPPPRPSSVFLEGLRVKTASCTDGITVKRFLSQMAMAHLPSDRRVFRSTTE